MPLDTRGPESPTDLKITEIRISPQNERALKAFVSITFNDCFVVRGLKIIQGTGGMFVAMPARKRKDESFQDIAHPITQEFRDYLEEVVLNYYEDLSEESESAEAPPAIRASRAG